jgi:hypothetical protein
MKGIYPDTKPAELRAMLDATKADVLVVGHTHGAMCLDAGGGRLVVNPGALLRDPAVPMDGPMLFDKATGTFAKAPSQTPGTFGILELPTRRFTVHRAKDGEQIAMEGAR